MKYALLFFISLFITACGSSDSQSPEQQVKAVLSAIEVGVEARSLSQVMEHISENYKDHRGNDKKTVARLMQFQILRNQNINIFTVIKRIEINNKKATVELSAAMAAKEVDLSIESNRLRANAHRFSILLENQDNQWRVHSVSWQRGW